LEKRDLIRRTICRDSTDDEFRLFLDACKKTGLDPCMRQIFSVKRWDSSLKKEVMTIQTGIDGYRLIADRTGKYVPGRDTEFGYDSKNNLKWARAFVKKMTPDGKWHEISATAFWDEYVQTKKDGRPTLFWLNKGHVMLGKCAESLALRKAFPAELSGIYTKDEMGQDIKEDEKSQAEVIPMKINREKAHEIMDMVKNYPDIESKLISFIEKSGGTTILDIEMKDFERVKKSILNLLHEKRVKEEEENGEYSIQEEVGEVSEDLEEVSFGGEYAAE